MSEIPHPVDRDAADRAYKSLPALNGYAETFSVSAGETLHVRVARKPILSTRAVFVERVNIKHAVTGRDVLAVRPKDRTEIFFQEPESYRDLGANYKTRIAIDTANLEPGVYECAIGDTSGETSREIFFNIRPRSFEEIDLVCVLPTFTWQAYNRTGGGCFYTKPLDRTLTVSLQRPVARRRDNTIEASLPFLKTFHEQHIRYACVDSMDLHRGVSFGSARPVMALLTHDEYWTSEMRATVDGFAQPGGVLAIFAGNVCWWRIELDGINIVVNKKEQQGLWHRQDAPEETTFVSSFRFGGYPIDVALADKKMAPQLGALSPEEIADARGMEIVEPGHPIFQGAAAGKDNRFGGNIPIMYREVDGVPLNPDGTFSRRQYKADAITPRILATGLCGRGRLRKAGVIVEADVGRGHVLHLGTFGWSKGLAEGDKAIRQIVLNAYNYCRTLVR